MTKICKIPNNSLGEQVFQPGINRRIEYDFAFVSGFYRKGFGVLRRGEGSAEEEIHESIKAARMTQFCR